jgi:hypothetical protein
MVTSTHDPRRPFLRELQQLELSILRVSSAEPSWLAPHDEAALRWALSLARISVVPVALSDGGEPDLVEIGHATDGYRQRLHDLLAPCVSGDRVQREALRVQIPAVRELVRDERRTLGRLLKNRMPLAALDRATRKRPLALALSGGGGTAYVFVGALALLEESGLVPSVITGSSMGAIIGAFRARTREFELKNVKALMTRVTMKRVFRMFETSSRFGIPATLKLYLREVLGTEFERDGRFLRMTDLEIPFRVCVAGITQGEAPEELERYAHLLDDAVDDVRRLRRKATQIARALSEIAKKPVKPIYIGGDELTREFDVLDAVGFSAAVPAIIHYDILRDDPRMVALVTELMRREGVFRFIDGGLADNLPAREAWQAIQNGASGTYDPFVLALDSFAPNLSHHLLFLPLMQIAAANTRVGRQVAHVVIRYKNVLSPLSVVPTQTEFLRAIENGRKETEPEVGLIRKVVGPIPDPPGVIVEMDGT